MCLGAPANAHSPPILMHAHLRAFVCRWVPVGMVEEWLPGVAAKGPVTPPIEVMVTQPNRADSYAVYVAMQPFANCEPYSVVVLYSVLLGFAGFEMMPHNVLQTATWLWICCLRHPLAYFFCLLTHAAYQYQRCVRCVSSLKRVLGLYLLGARDSHTHCRACKHM
jgi:hypothetical protein